MAEEYFSKIRHYLDIFDKISEIICNDSGEGLINLPKTVIIGMQSTGKSSILKRITGLNIPCDNKRCTVCPLQIRLRKAMDREYTRIKINDSNHVWYEIENDEIAEKIIECQKEIVKNGNSPISDKLIILEVNRNENPDLTLIDLPGVTYDQSIQEEFLINMIIEYIKDPETIVLFTHDGTQDFTTNGAIKILRKIEEDYKDSKISKRTVPIITKIDKTDIQHLRNIYIDQKKQFNFKYPPIMVRNGSYEELDKDISEEDLKKKEDAIINNPHLKQYYHNPQGIKSLVNLLINIQNEYIVNYKPEIKNKIKEYLEKLKATYENFPKLCENRQDYNEEIADVIASFEELLEDQFDKADSLLPNSDLDAFDYCLETKIRMKFNQFQEKYTQQFYSFLTINYYRKLEKILFNSKRLKLDNFYGEECVYKILKRNLRTYFSSIYCLIKEVRSLILYEVEKSFNKAFKKYEGMLDQFINESRQTLTKLSDENLDLCTKYFEYQKNIEKAGIYSVNKYYLNIANMIQNQIEKCLYQGETIIIDDILKNKQKYEVKIEEEKEEEKEEEEGEGEGEKEKEKEVEVEEEEEEEKNKSENTEETQYEEESDEEKEVTDINMDIKNENISNLIKNNYGNINPENDMQEYFYFYTCLDKEVFIKFIKDLNDLNNNGYQVNKDIIKIICSIYSYLKVFMDRFLDNIYKGCLYHLLYPFQEKRFSTNLIKKFSDMTDEDLNKIIGGSDETKMKIANYENKINELTKIYYQLDGLC
ncbi:P-loop containing nucleoside triphosphate hydrolase protein [Neocallimastix californiae]|uniref:p-loop containing nucleoside triphosphate hydrolase protein n=1 Tax=Neocallimastix californiae TaxID=1754190 RepID=A0A1Y2FE50_9FUNG|nr:P-loop containing nucleoside triphosphate hydrolase protein [Neocallimastix californiae]|eukprot:ORY81694.1 P-loop containing nucleoside triphosphate hydrolase protein [Neocallimastix californiae]